MVQTDTRKPLGSLEPRPEAANVPALELTSLQVSQPSIVSIRSSLSTRIATALPDRCPEYSV